MSDREGRRRAARVLAALLWLLAAGWGIGSYPLAEPDEGRNGTAALEVATEGRWLLPSYDGLDLIDKPLLWFDAAALSVRVLGATELAVRLPSLLFTFATVLLVAWFARRLYGPDPPGRSAAGIATLAFASSPLVLAYARITIFDATLTFFVVLALVLFHEAIERESRKHAAFAWAAMALGVLTKGPVALAIPLMVALPYAVWRRRARSIWSWIGAAGFVLAVGSWVAVVAGRVPGYLDYVLVTEVWGRLSPSGPPRADLGSSASLPSLVPVVAAGALPWSLLAGWAWLARWWARRSDEATAGEAGGASPSNVYLVLWLVLPTLFLGLAEPVRIQYALPALPAVALLLGAALTRGLPPGSFAGALRIGAAPWLLLGGALLVAGSSVWAVLTELPDGVRAPARTTALALGVLFFAAAGTAAWLSSRRPVTALIALALPGLLLPAVALPVLASVSETRSARSLAHAIAEQCPDAHVVGIDALPSTLPFYLGRPVGLASETGRPFQSNFVESRWPSIVARRGAGPLFTRTGWEELPPRVVVVFERKDQAKRTGAELRGLAFLAENRRYTTFSRGCGGASEANGHQSTFGR